MTVNPRRVWWGIAIGLCALEFVLSSIPGPDLAAVGFDLWDKAAHAMMYGAIAGAFALALARPRAVTTLLVAAGIAIAYGITDELHQLFTPHRDASLDDLVADAVGALAGAATGAWLVYRRRRDAA